MLPEEQKEIISNFDVQLQNRMRCASLEILCVRKVADTLPYYAKQRSMNLSSLLPTSLCSLVYHEVLWYLFEDDSPSDLWIEKWRACNLKDQVNLFAGKSLKEFNCKILNEQNEVPDSQPFDELAKFSPKLKSFKDNHRLPGKFKNLEAIPLNEYYSLKTMPKLEVLELNFYPAKDADLEVISFYLPLLQRLKLFVAMKFGHSCSVSFRGLDYLTNLETLKHLTFEVDNFLFDNLKHNECVQLLKYCLQLMPQVNTNVSDLLPHEFPKYEKPVELGLEHFVLGAKSVIPSNVTLPNVTHITVYKAPLAPVSLEQFKKIRWLTYLQSNDWSQVEQTLNDVGNRLQILKLGSFSSYYSCQLKQVLLLCQNLERLYLEQVNAIIPQEFHASELQNCVKNLKIFSLEFGGAEFFDSNGLLNMLLTSCPELQELIVYCIRLSKEEVDLINDEMKSGAIAIKKLQKIEILAFVDQETIESYRCFECMLRVKNCNVLKHVKIDFTSGLDNDEDGFV